MRGSWGERGRLALGRGKGSKESRGKESARSKETHQVRGEGSIR